MTVIVDSTIAVSGDATSISPKLGRAIAYNRATIYMLVVNYSPEPPVGTLPQRVALLGGGIALFTTSLPTVITYFRHDFMINT